MTPTSGQDDRRERPPTAMALPLTVDPHLAALRIQTAAVVAQQSALMEVEIRLTDRESALSRQEDQVATHLESQRRQLLDLQDQITQARASLREKRAAFTAMSAEHEGQLKTTRREVEREQKKIAAREARLARLWRKFKDRIRRQQVELASERRLMAKRIERVEQTAFAEKETYQRELQKLHGDVELEKRQIADCWQKLRGQEATVRDWLTAMNARERDLARREKELSATELKRRQSEMRDLARREGLVQEIGHLETRANNLRAALEQYHHWETALVPSATPPVEPAPTDRERRLHEVADTLADEHSLLTEHVDRFAKVRLEWEEERLRALQEFDVAAAQLAERERNLAIRDAELAEAEARIAAEEQAAAARGQEREAERVRMQADVASRQARLDRQAEELAAQARELDRREETLIELYQSWGKRRTDTIAGLKSAQAANAAAHDAWTEFHGTWLRTQARLIADQQDLAARQLAVEQHRRELLDSSDHPEVAERRLERLRRQWLIRCNGAKKDLIRLSTALKSESDRLEKRFAELQREESRITLRAADVDDLRAISEVQRAAVAIERIRHQQETLAQKAIGEAYEKQIQELHGQLDQLASLFIESIPSTESRAA